MLASPAISTARATQKSRLAALDVPEFWRLIHSQKSFAEAVAANLSARIETLFSTSMGAPDVNARS